MATFSYGSYSRRPSSDCVRAESFARYLSGSRGLLVFLHIMHRTTCAHAVALSAARSIGTLRAVYAIASLGFVAIAVACGTPTQPTSQIGRTVHSPELIGVTIAGPATIGPGESVAYTATAKMNDGSTADYTQKVLWTASPSSVLTILHTGQATGRSVGDATVQAAPFGIGCCSATVQVVVVPPNTYRLVGRVLESRLPVVNASVVVLSGIGTGLSATTDNGGGYRLYGVAGPIQVRVSKPGYDDIIKTFTATQNDVLDFPEAHQSAAIPSFGGVYTLTLTADPACPETPSRGIAPLSDSLRQPRPYMASLAQSGPSVTVTLSDPSILSKENQFSGRVTPDGIDFTIGQSGYGYYYYGPSLSDGVSDQLSTTQVLTMGGTVHVPRSGSTLAGSLSGPFEVFVTSPFTQVVQECVATNHQFTLTRATAQASRHR